MSVLYMGAESGASESSNTEMDISKTLSGDGGIGKGQPKARNFLIPRWFSAKCLPPSMVRVVLTPVETFNTVELCAHLSSLRCEQLHRALRQLVQRLMLHPLNQNWFNAPVDATALHLPDYHELVRTPMDLGTIKSRLASLTAPRDNASCFGVCLTVRCVGVLVVEAKTESTIGPTESCGSRNAV